ncbi:hypothetical protein BAE44_0015269, partial [Dichanthelium oligosanthes]
LRVRRCGGSARYYYLSFGRFNLEGMQCASFQRTHYTVEALIAKIKDEAFAWCLAGAQWLRDILSLECRASIEFFPFCLFRFVLPI